MAIQQADCDTELALLSQQLDNLATLVLFAALDLMLVGHTVLCTKRLESALFHS